MELFIPTLLTFLSHIKQSTWATACEHVQSTFRGGPWHHVPELLGTWLTQAKGRPESVRAQTMTFQWWKGSRLVHQSSHKEAWKFKAHSPLSQVEQKKSYYCISFVRWNLFRSQLLSIRAAVCSSIQLSSKFQSSIDGC